MVLGWSGGGGEDKPTLEQGKDKDKNEEKLRRKLNRKRNKFVNLVNKDVGLSVSLTEESNWLILWGYGLLDGTRKEDLRTKYQGIEEIRYLFDKPYAFIKFKKVEEARRVKDEVEQEGKDGDTRKVVLVGYLVGDPPEEDKELIQPFLNPKPSGLRIIQEFVTEEEEGKILSRLILSPCPREEEERVTKTLKHRWVRHFGYEFRYGSNDIDLDLPLDQGIPDYLDNVLDKMKERGVFQQRPEQLTVNQYSCGQGIPPHVDTHSCFESPIVSLSLGADTVMNFRRGKHLYSLILRRRALLVMDGESRLGWTHGIANRTFDIVPDPLGKGLDVLHRSVRTSLTFRKLKKDQVCHCQFPELCNSQKGKISSENASELESKLVHLVYENIAPHFHETRHTPWPRVKEFVKSVGEGGVLLDIGCGNGKYFHPNSNIVQVGTDMSIGLLDICRGKGAEVLRANALQLPFKDESFNAVICIAVLHHISTNDRRLSALEEIARVLTKQGQALIYVWSKTQHYQNEQSVYSSHQTCKETKIFPSEDPCDLKSSEFGFLPIHNRESDFTQNDVLVPWVNTKQAQNSIHHRYYHVFNEGELEDLIKQVGEGTNVKITDKYYDQGNWVVKFTKL